MAPRVSTRGALATSGEGKKEMMVDGTIYDVTGFKHPGGSIIKFGTGQDVTSMWREFHMRSTKAKKYLANLPRRTPVSAAEAKTFKVKAHGGALEDDFETLRAELEDEGFFEPDPLHVAWRLFEIAALHALGFYLVFGATFAAHTIVGLCALGIVQGRCGWLMHEGGHYSLTGAIGLDRQLQMFLYGYGCGMSASFWRNQHNKHHATPQKLGHDVDLATLPLVAFHSSIAAKAAKSAPLRAWLKLQGVLFAPFTTFLVVIGWQSFLHPRHSARTKNAVECFWMVARYATWWKIFGSWGAASAFGAYCVYTHVAAVYIFTNFAVSHTHKPVTRADERLDWVRYSANHTTNCTPSWWCNWWMAYLNFQIEHHLFPSMPQYRHPIVAPRVRALLEKHGVEYDVRSYWTCLAATTSNLHRVGNPHHHRH
jgi:fatty acid desaturase